MKLSCEIIKDLLPIYCDNICSEETKSAVEEHLTDCVPCSEELKKMKSNMPVALLKKREGGFIIGRYKANLIRKFLILFLCVFALPLFNALITKSYYSDYGMFGYAFFISAAVLIPNVYIQKIKAKDSPIRVFAYSTLFLILIVASSLRFSGVYMFFPDYNIYYSIGNLITLAPILVYSVFAISFYVLRFKKDPLPPAQYKKTTATFLLYETELLLYLSFVATLRSMNENWPLFLDTITTALILGFVWLLYFFFRFFKRKIVFNIGVCLTVFGIYAPTYFAVYEMVRHNSFHAAAAFWNANFFDSNNPANFYMQFLIIACTIGAVLILIGLLTEKKLAQSKQSEHKEEEEEHEQIQEPWYEQDQEQEQEAEEKQEQE